MPLRDSIRQHLNLTARVIVFLSGVLFMKIQEWIDRARLRKQRFVASIPYFLHDIRGQFISYFYKDRIKQIHEAVNNFNISKIEQLLDGCTNEQVFRSALCSAVTLDDTLILDNILKQMTTARLSDNFYKQQKCQYNQSPLHLSCSRGKENAVTLLLRYRFSINVLDEYNRTPLWEAIYNEHSSVAALLLSCDDVDVNTETSELIAETNATPLHHACFYGNTDCVRALLSCGADINARDTNRQTPLYTACKHGHIQIVTILLKSGAEINQKSEKEITTAYSARFVPLSERYRVIKYAKYPLMAAIDNCYPAIVNILVSYGAHTRLELPFNLTPLHVACSEGTVTIAETLIKNGANVNVETNSGQTPLFYCLRNGKYQTKWHVYRINNDSRAYDKQTWDSYLDSIEEGNVILEYLIQQGANLNHKDHIGLTPVDHAWISSRTYSLFILLKYGGKISGNFLQEENLKKMQIAEPNINLFRIVMKNNLEFRKILPDYIETLNFKSVTSEDNLLSFLTEIQQPCSLKDLCRVCIRSCLDKYGIEFQKCINSLGLPRSMRSFLMLSDIEHCVHLRDICPDISS